MLCMTAAPAAAQQRTVELPHHRQRPRLPGLRHQRQQDHPVPRAPVPLPAPRARPIRTPRASGGATSPSTSTSACAAAAARAGSTRRPRPAIPSTSTRANIIRAPATARRRHRRVVLLRALRLRAATPWSPCSRRPAPPTATRSSTSTWARPRRPTRPAPTARAIRDVTASEGGRRDRPGRRRHGLRAAVGRRRTPTAATSTPRSRAGWTSPHEHVLQRQRRRPRLPEEARRRRLDGRRRRRSSTSTNPADADAAAAAMTTWANNRAPDQILADARAEFEAWRKPPPATVPLCSDNETRLWRQCEAVLRMGQIREPNTATRKNNGMILATPAAGLVAHGLGARRDLRRRGAGALGPPRRGQGRARLLPRRRRRSAATPATSNNVNYRISLTRYFGNGDEECDWNSIGPEHRDRRLGPRAVGGARLRRGLGRHGLARRRRRRTATVYDVMQAQVAGALECEPRDLERHRARRLVHLGGAPATSKHFAYTTLAAARGFCDMAAMAKQGGQGRRRHALRDAVGKVNEAFQSAFRRSADGARRIARGAAAQQVLRRRRSPRRSTGTSCPTSTGPVATATLSLFEPPARRLGRLQAQRRRAVLVRQQRVDPRRPAHLQRAAPRRQDAPKADGYLGRSSKGGGELLPAARALQRRRRPTGRSASTSARSRWSATARGAYIMTMLDRAGPLGAERLRRRELEERRRVSPCSGQAGGGDGGTGGGSGGTGGGGDGDGGTARRACRIARLLVRPRSRRTLGGAMAFMGLPWLLLAARLRARPRASASEPRPRATRRLVLRGIDKRFGGVRALAARPRGARRRDPRAVRRERRRQVDAPQDPLRRVPARQLRRRGVLDGAARVLGSTRGRRAPPASRSCTRS